MRGCAAQGRFGHFRGSTDVDGLAVRPGAFDECASRLGVPRLGDRALTTPLTTGVCWGGPVHVTHELSGVVNARQLTQFRDASDGHGAWHAPQGVKGLDHRLQAPGVPLLLEGLFETLQACGVLVHRPDRFREDDWRRRGGTDRFRAPAPVGWALEWSLRRR
jgi:hypothetical protein